MSQEKKIKTFPWSPTFYLTPERELLNSTTTPIIKIRQSTVEPQHIGKPFEKYSINLFWTYKNKREYKYIAPEDKLDIMIDTAKKWKRDNPHAIINLWYDSGIIVDSQTAINNTISYIKDKTIITLRDMKSICEKYASQVKHKGTTQEDRLKLFTDKSNVYLRADLQRVICAYDDIKTDKRDCFVFVNIDLPSVTHAELFDEHTVKQLKQYGMVLNHNLSYRTGGPTKPYENSFFMLTKENEIMLKAYKDVLIDGVIHASTIRYANSRKNYRFSGQFVYEAYTTLMNYYYGLIGKTYKSKSRCQFNSNTNNFELLLTCLHYFDSMVNIEIEFEQNDQNEIDTNKRYLMKKTMEVFKEKKNLDDDLKVLKNIDVSKINITDNDLNKLYRPLIPGIPPGDRSRSHIIYFNQTDLGKYPTKPMKGRLSGMDYGNIDYEKWHQA